VFFFRTCSRAETLDSMTSTDLDFQEIEDATWIAQKYVVEVVLS